MLNAGHEFYSILHTPSVPYGESNPLSTKNKARKLFHKVPKPRFNIQGIPQYTSCRIVCPGVLWSVRRLCRKQEPLFEE